MEPSIGVENSPNAPDVAPVVYMFNTTETVHIPVNSFSSDDPTASVTITNLAAGDIEIHKDGSTTQRASDSGVTVSIDFDSITGNHMIHIDLSDNDDAGFYAQLLCSLARSVHR